MGRPAVALLITILLTTSCVKTEPDYDSLRMPAYPNASLYKHITPDDGKSDEMYLESGDTAQGIIAHYIETLKRDGWKVTTNSGFGVMSMLSAEKGRMIMGVRVFEKDGRRVIHQSIKRQRKLFRW